MLRPTILYMKFLWNRLQMSREDDRGMTSEAIVVTALLVAAALFAIGLIAQAIQDEAPNIANDISDP